MNDNIIMAVFNHNTEITTKPSTQWNRGQVLKIEGIYNLPTAFEVEVSNDRERGAKRYLGNDYQFVIPDEYFESGKMIYIWIMKRVEPSDITSKYLVKIPMRTRQKPLDYDVDSEKRDIVAEAIVALQDAEQEITTKMDEIIDREEKIERIEESFYNLTALAETLPPGSEATVEKEKVDTDEENYMIFRFGIPKGEKGDKGDTYTLTQEDKAEIINGFTEQFNNFQAQARQMVSSAEGHEQNARSYSEQSANNASVASSAAQTATTKANEAKESANTAISSATEASSHAQVSREYSASASQSATDAETYKDNAENAAIEAVESAETATQSATSATASANSASASASSAEGYASDALNSKTVAQTSAESAESAKNAAQSAQTAVEQAQTQFNSAVTTAINDVNTAGTNQKELARLQAEKSEAWAVGKRNGIDVGQDDDTYHNNAKYYSDQIADNVSIAQTAATNASTSATEAERSAQSANKSAEDALNLFNSITVVDSTLVIGE